MTAAASPARPDQPGWLDPELATLTRDRFSDPAWIFERKLDGERCLAFRSGGQVRLMTRNQKDDTSTYPEISQALEAQRAGDFIIDGEIVAFDGSQTRFARLQQLQRMDDRRRVAPPAVPGPARRQGPRRRRPGDAARQHPVRTPPCAPGYRREVSSVTMSAADCDCLARATPCPAHIESASISPVVPAIGGAGS